MGERGDGDRLHVVRGDEVAPGERGAAAGELEQGEAAARARADGEARARAGRRDEGDDVAADRGIDVDELDGRLHREQRLPVDHLGQRQVVLAALDPARQHLPLGVRARIAEARAQQEAVELGLGEGIRALVLDRVLGREDEERAARAAA